MKLLKIPLLYDNSLENRVTPAGFAPGFDSEQMCDVDIFYTVEIYQRANQQRAE